MLFRSPAEPGVVDGVTFFGSDDGDDVNYCPVAARFVFQAWQPPRSYEVVSSSIGISAIVSE